LYLGRTASFVQATQGLTSTEAEEKVEALCQTFERMKPYLFAHWQPQALQSGQPALLRHATTATTTAAGGVHE
jgi:hypothetical protein